MRTEDQFLDRMRSELADGTYPPGTVLPTQRDLAAQYGHDVREIRAAMQRLEAAGLVRIRRKAGTVVLDPTPVRRMGIERYARHRWAVDGVAPFESDVSAESSTQPTVDQRNEVSTVAAPEDVATALQVNTGDAVVYRRRKLFDSADQPTHILTSWYRANDVVGTELMDTEPGTAGRGGGFAVLHRAGLGPDEIAEELELREPTTDEATELDIPPTLLVVDLRRWVWTANGRPVEYARGIHHSLRFRWSYRFKVPE